MKNQTLSTIEPFVAPHRWTLTGAVALNAIHGFAVTFQVFTVGWLVDWVLGKGEVPSDMWSRAGLLAAAYFLVSTFGRMVSWHLGYRLFTKVREKILAAVRAAFFRQVNALCLRFHMKRSSGELFSYLFGSPLQNIIQFYQHCSAALAGAVTTILSSVGMLLVTDDLLTLILATGVATQVLMMNSFRQANRRIHLEFQGLESQVTGTVADLLRGSRAVKMYAMESAVQSEFGEQIQIISKKSYEKDVRVHLEWMKQETLQYFCFALMLLACAWRFREGHITIGQISMFLLAFQQLTNPLNVISQAFALWGGAQASIERIGEVLRTASTTPDPIGTVAVVPPAGAIEFRRVTFSYEDRVVLRDVSFTIPYGQSVALVGPSGSGKSTIAQLLLRLYDPDSGEVLFGGQNLRHCVGADIRRRFGIVPQDPFIFRTDIRQNLRVASPNASDEEIERACRMANAWEFIEKLPHGLDTKVGEGGASLSGGQRQRLAIARSLLANPPVFIFDEATSALDTLSEELIQKTMREVSRGRTSIVIAHRLATVRDCDRILVVQQGQIVQDGTYDQLASQAGLFRSLVEGQLLSPLI